MNILIVDDEYYIVKNLVSAIDREGLRIDNVFTAYSASQAKEILVREQVDILLADIEMPKESGLELIGWLNEKRCPCLVIILSSHQRFDYAQEAIRFQCFRYLLKPIGKPELNKVLNAAISVATESNGNYERKDRPAEKKSPAAFDESPDDSEDFVKKIRDYISKNLASDLSRDNIAKYMNMNPDYLSFLFHNKFNETLTNYITRMRIDLAKYYLNNSSRSIEEISEMTGFSDQTYFIRKFKQITGLSPRKWKES